MAPRTVYNNLADGLQNLSLWDQSLADMGALGVIPCTAVGTNSIVLTPIASVFPPNVATPQALQLFSFVAVANSTGLVTVKAGTLTGNLYRMDGVTQASTGDITATVTYLVNYNSALNSAAGGFQILAPISNEINPIISGATITNSTYNGNTWTAGTGTLTLGTKTLAVSNSLTLAGTDSTTATFPTTSATIARTDAGQTFTGTNVFGVLTATSVNGLAITSTGGGAALNIGSGAVFTVSNTLTLSGTNGTTMTFPTTSATLARTDAANTFTGVQTFASQPILSTLTASSAVATDGSKGLVSVTNTGTGNNVLATSPTLVTPALGAATATSINGVTIDNTAWSTYTPVVTSQGGTITTSSATGRYKQIGKTVFMQVDVTITTAGTGSGGLRVTLPLTAAAFNFAGTSRDVTSGKAGSANVLASGTFLDARDATGATYIISGDEIICGVTYEVP